MSGQERFMRQAPSSEPSALLLTVLAAAAGALVANLYYAQPLVAAIAPEIGVSQDLAGSLVSVTQIGYGLGLFFLVSVADLLENRRLVLVSIAITTLGLIGVATAHSMPVFLVSALLIGVFSSGAQVLIPFLAHLVPEERRGRVVGNAMGGLLAGIMLARPASLFIASSFGWRTVFWASAVLMVVIGVALARLMPRHAPKPGLHYGHILGSMWGLLRDMPFLRWRSAYQALLFAAFNLFWTAVPLMLAEHFGLNGHQIGLFALAGAGGALAAPVAGRLADRGHGMAMTAASMLFLAVSFLATGWSPITALLGVLVVLTIIIDAAVQTNQVVSQRIIFTGAGHVRGRVNAIYMTLTFAGGAIGSILGTVTYHSGGWTLTALTGALAGLIAFALFALEQWQSRKTA